MPTGGVAPRRIRPIILAARICLVLAAIEGLLAAALRLTLDTWGYQFVDATSKILRIAGPVTGCLGGLLWAVSGRVDRARHRVLAVVTVIVGLLPVLILLGDVVEWPY